jgi:hypothetical protein
MATKAKPKSCPKPKGKPCPKSMPSYRPAAGAAKGK